MAEIPAGWPCASLPAVPPSVEDRQSAPSADDLLPQVLALAPRGPAWGTDEAGDGSGASPVQRRFWRAIAAWAADICTRDFEAATQTFPSAITYSLPDWEAELGLPGPCSIGQGGLSTRLAAVRARFAALGGQSPAYFTCVARAAGYDVTIEEPTQFLVDVSECIGGDPTEVWFFADGGGIAESYFRCDDGACDDDVLEGFAILAAAGDGSVVDDQDLVETYLTCDEGLCDDRPVEGFVLASSGSGDPLEALLLAPAENSDGDQVAGGLIEADANCDDAVCDDTPVESFDFDPNGTVWKFWVVHVASLGETWFRVDEGEVSADPIEGFVPATDLECLLRDLSPPHTHLVFDYSAAA